MPDRLQQFTEQRPALFGLAYRMLGVRADAEDIVQDAFLRWQQATESEEILSPRSYLLTTVARLSLDALKSARRTREKYFGEWLPEPIQPDKSALAVEKSGSLSLAFLFLLESLSPAERVAFLMREVFDEPYDAVARALETSADNARQLVNRARRHIQERRPRFTVDPVRHRAVFERFMQACITGDTSALFGMIRDDAVFHSDAGGKRNAAVNPIFGSDRIVRLILGLIRKSAAEIQTGYFTETNGLPAFAFTLNGSVAGIIAIDLDDADRIQGFYYVANPDKLSSVGQA